jgi:hypothetical protein
MNENALFITIMTATLAAYWVVVGNPFLVAVALLGTMVWLLSVPEA